MTFFNADGCQWVYLLSRCKVFTQHWSQCIRVVFKPVMLIRCGLNYNNLSLEKNSPLYCFWICILPVLYICVSIHIVLFLRTCRFVCPILLLTGPVLLTVLVLVLPLVLLPLVPLRVIVLPLILVVIIFFIIILIIILACKKFIKYLVLLLYAMESTR